MVKIEDYILLSREERRQHLDFSSPCDLRGGTSQQFKGLLAHSLGTTIPKDVKILLCHGCNIAGCSNVKHLYRGTYRDNYIDRVESGADKWKRPKEARVEHARSLGKKFGGQLKLTNETLLEIKVVIDAEPKTYGWKTRAASKLGVSHTHLNRYIKKVEQLG